MGFEFDNPYSQRSVFPHDAEAVPLPDASVLGTPQAQDILKNQGKLIPPTFWEGSLEATGEGLVKGAIETGRAAALIGTGVTAATSLVDTEITDNAYQSIDDLTLNLLQRFTPDANDLGMGAQILGGFAEMAAPLTLGGLTGFATGVPLAVPTLSATLGAQRGSELTQAGVDKTTASLSAGLEAGLSYAGANVPIYGTNLPMRLISASAGNVGAGVVYRAAQGSLLEAAGYNELADQYSPFDAANMAVDALTGALFGVYGETQRNPSYRPPPGSVSERVHAGVMPEAEQVAVARAANYKHASVDAAPGKPHDYQATQAHAKAMKTAAQQVSEGQNIDLSQVMHEFKGAKFRVKPAKLSEMRQAKEQLEALYAAEVQQDFPKKNIFPHTRPAFDPSIPSASQDAALEGLKPVEDSVNRQVENILKEIEHTAENEPGMEAKELSLPTQLVEDWINAHGDFEMPLSEDGTGPTISATEALKEAKKQLRQAKRMAKAVIAMAKCSLVRG